MPPGSVSNSFASIRTRVVIDSFVMSPTCRSVKPWLSRA
jgi:hypothetical protein